MVLVDRLRLEIGDLLFPFGNEGWSCVDRIYCLRLYELDKLIQSLLVFAVEFVPIFLEDDGLVLEYLEEPKEEGVMGELGRERTHILALVEANQTQLHSPHLYLVAQVCTRSSCAFNTYL